MGGWLALALFGIAVVVCTKLLIDALAGFLRASRGIDDDAVTRRLSKATTGSRSILLNIIRAAPEDGAAGTALQLKDAFHRLISQTGKPLKLRTLVLISACLSLAAVFMLSLIMPSSIRLLVLPFGILAGPGAVLLYLVRVRNARIARFEEQLPEAIDLVVRSLKVGHPLSVSLSVIARELAAPIGYEFGLAHDKVSYGLTIPDAFKEMSERVPLQDLRYLVAALQIQEEAGGNLIESLSKLAGVIRERFRMFRKVKAITAEGRMSAWLLSFFPIGIGIAIRLVKPDYFDRAMQTQNFPFVVAATVVLLIVNILMMNKITKIKV
jgi:tight adherence protein B